MPLAPQWFVSALQTMDPLLSVRWGDTIGQWVIERKAVIPPSELNFLIRREKRTRNFVDHPPADARPSTIATNRNTWVGVSEELVSARRGQRVILFTTRLDQQIYEMLCASDIQRYGGYARFADELERKESRQATDRARMEENSWHAFNAEVADMMHFIWHKRENALLAGKRSMRELLQQPESDEPVIKLTDV